MSTLNQEQRGQLQDDENRAQRLFAISTSQVDRAVLHQHIRDVLAIRNTKVCAEIEPLFIPTRRH
jgi:hypothetical protein